MRMVRFDPADGSTPTQLTVKTGTLALPSDNNPVRPGFRFNGWMHDGLPFDLQTPILQDTTLKAQWTKITDWTLSPNHGPASGAQLTISPPNRQEPFYTSIHAAGDQTVGLTGDGRIYTWSETIGPKLVPFPAQAPNKFHYLQDTADGQWQAALGSNHQIYTWNSRQATPTILNTGQDAGFTSISMNDNWLLAVDWQGQVHAFQARQTDNLDLNPKFTEQTTTSLHEQAQAVATATGSKTLSLDADGQVWTWDTTTEKAKPERIDQDAHVRFTQIQALNQGFLLLGENGLVRYLADGTISSTVVSLPGNTKASRITVNKNQATITDKDGHLWAWKPGDMPIRADNGKHSYMQAVPAGNKITALDRQGGIFTWSLNPQGQPGEPARINTSTASTLETVSLDGQALALSKKDHAWQANIPAREPGQADIVITGRQDGKPITRNLDYTVDQDFTRGSSTEDPHTVDFDTAGGSQAPGPQKVSYPYERVRRPTPDPVRKGYQFDGWFIGNIAYDFSKPVTGNLTLIAHWTSKDPDNTWSISPEEGSQLGGQKTTITPPVNTSSIKFNQISGSTEYGTYSLAVGSDGNAYAWGDNNFGQLGDGTTSKRTTPVPVKKPAGVPADFTYVQISAGNSHSLAIGSDGYVYAWGDNTYGQLGNNTTSITYSTAPARVRDPSNPSDTSKGLKAVQVSAGGDQSLAIDKDGNIWAWGYNMYGQLGNNTTSITYSTVPARVRDPSNPSDTSKGLKAVQVSAGGGHSLAIDKDGNIWAWGYNGWGQLSNDISDKFSAVPLLVRDPSNPSDTSKGLKAVQVSAGGDQSLAIDKDGNIWAWGYNMYGQLGNNTTSITYSTVPARVRDPSNPSDTSKGLKAVQVSAGGRHSLAIDKDGNVWAWGYNGYGQLGDNTTKNQYSPVKVFASAKSTNTANPWLNAAQIGDGYIHSLAIDTNGNARTWGDNSNGQLGNPGVGSRGLVPAPPVFPLQPVITGVTFDSTAAFGLTHGNDNSVTVTTPAHEPGPVTVSVDYTLGGAGSTLIDKSLTYTYTPAGVLPRAGGEGILLVVATGMTGLGGVLASRRHSREQR